MSLFTEDQLRELETVFGLKRAEILKVKDGYIRLGDMVWWRCDDGPVLVESSDHLQNIKNHPNAYSYREPQTKLTYLD